MTKPLHQSAPIEEQDAYGDALSEASILIVDDEPGMRNFLYKTLSVRCKRVEQAISATAATSLLDNAHFDLVILDNIMPDKTGLDWLAEQRKLGFFADTILITAYADLDTAIRALRAGVTDFVLKPFRANQILTAISRALDRKKLQRENYLLRHELSAEYPVAKGRLLGHSAKIAAVRQILEKVAPLQTSVLFTGASGTGKEIAARTLHLMSDRAERPFVPVNCATIAPEHMASNLFGQVEDGERTKDGLFLHANGGTLFLDEIAQMPMAAQAALLRVLEDRRIRPVGSEREIPMDIRVLFATNADLQQAVEAGTFRADLYHRINVMRIDMPTLAEREEDVVELAAMFMKSISRSLGMPALTLDADVLLKMRRYSWPGNVRELRNMIERSVILGEFPDEFAGGRSNSALDPSEALEAIEQRHIMFILDQCDGNRAEAARRLGVSRKTIDRKLAQWA